MKNSCGENDCKGNCDKNGSNEIEEKNSVGDTGKMIGKDKDGNNNDIDININIEESIENRRSKFKINLKVKKEEEINLANQANVKLSEKASKYQQYLKFLLKNNFTSLTYDDLCAFIIQFNWRRFYINEIKKEKLGKVDIIFSSLLPSSLQYQHTEQIIGILDMKKIGYKCYDLVYYKKLQEFLNELGLMEKLPCVFINGFYIGGKNDFQLLVDNENLYKIINRDYEEICLECGRGKDEEEAEICPYCKTKYNFFAKIDKVFDVWKERK